MMRVAVIGGGLAGSSAAWSLALSGKAIVTVFDQGRKPGGRASSREYDHLQRFDHGLQFMRREVGDEPSAVMDELIRAKKVLEWRPNIVRLGRGGANQWGFFDILKPGGSLFIGCPSSSSICEHLLTHHRINLRPATKVDSVSLSDSSIWSVQGEQFDALIFTDMLSASPRSPSYIRAEGERAREILSPLYASGSSFQGSSIFTLMLMTDNPLPFDASVIDSRHIALIVDESSKPGRLHLRESGGMRPITVITNESFGEELCGRDANGKLPQQSPAYLEERSQDILKALRSDLDQFGIQMKNEPSFIKCHRWGSAYPKKSLMALDPSLVLKGRFALAGDFLGNNGAISAIRSGQIAAKSLQ